VGEDLVLGLIWFGFVGGKERILFLFFSLDGVYVSFWCVCVFFLVGSCGLEIWRKKFG
jgi:hypothetical protein